MPNKNFNPDGIDYKLFTPGPVHVPGWILKEMSKENDTHRGVAYQGMHKPIREMMQTLLNTKNEILLFANSATGIMEACVRNLIKDDETALFLSCGAFGDRWAKIAKLNGKNADLVTVDWGKAVTPELVAEKIKEKKYSVVFLTYNETSTGVMNPLSKIAPIVKSTGALLCVDAVSAMAGAEIRVDDWGIDVVLASVQKCFAIPPGLATCAISDAALKKAESVKNRGFYLDFLAIKKKGEGNEHPVTPPIPQIRALKAVLEKIINEEGIENRYKNQLERSKMIQDWAINNGFELFSEEGYHSPTVVTINNNKNIDVGKFVSNLFDLGYKIVNGYGPMKGKNFRIAAMGFLTKEDTQKMLDAATKALEML
jgi:aspartate aminotransferase-like enzyme